MLSIPKTLPLFLLICALGASCQDESSTPDADTPQTDPADAGSEKTDPTDASTGKTLGDAERLYLAATETLTQGLDTADCKTITALVTDYQSYSAAMTDTQYQSLAASRFKPVLDFMSRQLCNQFRINGDVEAYKSDALAASPAGEFLSGTPLLQAIVDQSSDLEALLATANQERSAQGLDPIIVADYVNSVVGGPTSTIVFFPGWPGRPKLDQWLQVQRTIHEMFFISLEPRDDGTYASYVHGRSMSTTGSTTTVASTFSNGTCLECHYSGKPIHMRPLDDTVEAAKVATLVKYLQKYPAQTNHPDYNPFPGSPGIGTGGTLTLEEASTYAGRTLTATELDTLNKNTACDTCHNGTIQNPLRPPYSRTVDILMANGIMPPGSGVPDKSEREEAIKVMNAAYKAKLKRYFLGD